MFLNAPAFKVPLFSFLDNNCILFSESEEGDPEYQKIHSEFINFLDDLLAVNMEEINITNEVFQKTIKEA